jgi:type VI secretion system protein ImpK
MNTPLEIAAQECFDALLHLRDQGQNLQLGVEKAHQSMMVVVQRFADRARHYQVQERDFEDARYAIVALTDEMMMRNAGPLRDYWMSRPLQLHYYRENTAGDVFFSRLQAVMNDPQRRAVLRIYATCLGLGFRGKFGIRGGELQVEALIKTIREQLGLGGAPTPISLRHERPREAKLAGNGRFPALWVAFLIFVFATGLVTVLKTTLDHRSSNLVERTLPLQADNQKVP